MNDCLAYETLELATNLVMDVDIANILCLPRVTVLGLVLTAIFVCCFDDLCAFRSFCVALDDNRY